MGIVFKGSPEPTLGVEIELQTIDPASKALVSGAPRILELYPDHPHIKKELLQSCLELNTAICRDVGEVETDLKARLSEVLQVAQRLGMGLIAAGTHPFSCWMDQEVTPDSRYHTQLERTQWTARRMLTFGLHVHVGISSAEKAIAVFNAMTSYVPHLLALSASSPFWEGMDTGLESARSKVFEALPGGGLPFRVRNWTEFQRMIRVLQRIGSINSIQEVWGDLRPHSRYGTLEMRVCDAMSNLHELLAVTAFVQTLVVWLGDLYDRGSFIELPRFWVLQENKWRAARFGTHCRLVVNENGDQQLFRNLMEDLLEQLSPVAEALGCWHYLQRIERMLEHGGSSVRQRHLFHCTGSLPAVVEGLEEELRISLMGGEPPCVKAPLVQPVEHPRFRDPLHNRGALVRDN